MVLEGIVGSDVVDLVLMGAPTEVVVHDWYEYSRILAAFTLLLASANWFARFRAFCWTASYLARISFCFSKAWSWRLRAVSSSWLDPEGSVPSGIPLGG